MTDVAEQFLLSLADRGFRPLLQKTTGTLAIRLLDGSEVDEWLLAVDEGDVSARRGAGDADATLTVERSLFVEMVQGRANAMAAVLRGEVRIVGDLDLLMAVQRAFPGPDDPRTRLGAAPS
jgi:putative sterol carrier protein